MRRFLHVVHDGTPDSDDHWQELQDDQVKADLTGNIDGIATGEQWVHCLYATPEFAPDHCGDCEVRELP